MDCVSLRGPAPRIASRTFSCVAGRGFPQRQAHLGRAAAEQRGGILDRRRAGLDEQRLVQRHQPLVDPAHRRDVALLPGRVQLRAQRRCDMAVTEMQPSPLCARKPTAVPSSPDSIEKSSPTSIRSLVGPAQIVGRILDATMFGSLASRASVALVMSTEVRPGML